ncbi:hypothetical protein FD27_GL001374 [Limosilactobacillus frumenti DSM 13145]|uniref:Lipoprotein n=1 Tax=Limosilactobacillus frumenti DSM 13145 TaxID=1423746 RepID=A0A0R1P6D2_9LACO|nr:hypothetical protein [Limosilactobacillus frumenti]KRL25988.1 hypothetical protein FD27_GL001374 [Limosilactobacillus frumenti DSM 13145]MBA2914002.1 hypothetical protein [Limosilactobacillus frumenti]QFG72004.1 hypothetical protein LF145_00790 [Limosilactobacillus frumenti]
MKHQQILALGLLPLTAICLTACGNNSKSSSTSSSSNSAIQRSASNSTSSSSNNDASVSQLQPKQVAAAVLTAGAKDNGAWSNLKDSATNGDGNLQVTVISSDGPKVTQAGTGTFYMFTLGDQTGGMINGYTMSPDGKTIYLYSEGTHDSAERTVLPFKTISASQVIQIAHSGSINDIADNAKITADN